MADLIRVSIVGALPSGEEWSVNPCFRLNAQDVDVTFAQASAIALAVDAITIPAGIRNMMSTSTSITGCRIEARTNEGVLEAQADHVRSSPIVGTGAAPHPFQTSAVVSLRTPLAGASGRGRIFWPATGMGLTGTTLRPTSGDVLAALTGTSTFLAAIDTAITASVPDVILAVWSRKLNTTLGVTRLQMGDILDVQRRRRDSLFEAYQQVDYP